MATKYRWCITTDKSLNMYIFLFIQSILDNGEKNFVLMNAFKTGTQWRIVASNEPCKKHRIRINYLKYSISKPIESQGTFYHVCREGAIFNEI
jgi:hypothetical protein